MKAVVDRDLCIGCDLCEDTCPEVFLLAEDGLAVVLGDKVAEELYGPVRDAADLCPVNAISIVD